MLWLPDSVDAFRKARYLLQLGSQLVLPEALCQEGCVR